MTYRFRPRIVKHIRRNINSLPINLIRPAGIIPQTRNHIPHIRSRSRNALPVIQALHSSQQLRVLLSQVGELVEQDAALLRDGFAPGCEGGAGGVDGEVDVFGGAFADGGYEGFGGGVVDFEALFVDAFDPLVVDEAGGVSGEVKGGEGGLQADGLGVGPGEGGLELNEE